MYSRTFNNRLRAQGILLLMLLTIGAFPQNVAINADGSLPNKNAILDIKSGNKGLLIPRMTTDARLKIEPTQGLMVYDVNTNSFWYNDGKAWNNMAAAAILAATGPWLVTGNAGTNNTNFLGTTDNAPLNIRVKNEPSGRIDPVLFNTFWGYRSGFLISTGNDNTGLGSNALFHNATGYNNTGVGSSALMTNSTGWHNTAVGRLSLQANRSGFNNTVVGAAAMLSNTTGSNNTAIGSDALYFNTSGIGNTAVGGEALYRNTTANLSTAVGFHALHFNTAQANTALGGIALQNNTTGDANFAAGYAALNNNTTGRANTAVGAGALIDNTTGSENTAVGHVSLTNNITGDHNTALGLFAEVSSGDLTNAMALGYAAVVNASNKVRIGNGAVTVIEGQVPFTFPSDGRFKFGVQENIKGLDFVMQLRPVTYNFDTRRFDEQFTNGKTNAAMEDAYAAASSIRRSGFIAQEVEQAAKKAGYDFSGIIVPGKEQGHYSLSYDAFVVPLVKAMQEQQQIIDQQNKRIAGLEREMAEIKKLLQQQK